MATEPEASGPGRSTGVGGAVTGSAPAPRRASLARNLRFNLVGHLVPVAVALAAVPALIGALGVERFGILTLVWAVIGYFGVLDLGLSRATTKLVSERLGADDRGSIPALVSTALALLAGLGVAAAVLVWVGVLVVEASVVASNSALRAESTDALVILAATIPAVTVSVGLVGVLSAAQRFDWINYVRIPVGVLNYLGPLVVAQVSPELPAVVAVVAITRLASCVLYLRLSVRALPELQGRLGSFDRFALPPLVKFGGWLSVSNVVGSLMMYGDRFMLAFLVPAAAIAFYTTPFELITRLLVVPAALAAVVFPAFSFETAQRPAAASRLYPRAAKLVALALFPVALVCATFAYELLAIWLGRGFAASGAPVLALLALGVAVNGIAYVPVAYLQGNGRPDTIARVHLLELPVYALGFWFAAKHYGPVGAAVAWTTRAVVDALLMFLAARRAATTAPESGLPASWWVIGAGIGVLALVLQQHDFAARGAFVAVSLSGLAILAWCRGLEDGDKAAIRAAIGLPSAKQAAP